MKKIKLHKIEQSNRFVIESIRLKLKSQQSRIKKIGRFVTLPDQRRMSICRSRNKKRQLSSTIVLKPIDQKQSIPMKLSKWQAIEQQQMRIIKSQVKPKKQNKTIAISVQQVHNNKQVVKIGSIIFVKEMFQEISTKSAHQKRGITSLMKFKSFKGVNPISLANTKLYLRNNITESPSKISRQLPQIIKSKGTQPLRYIYNSQLGQRCSFLQGQGIKMNRWQQNDLSPWSTDDEKNRIKVTNIISNFD